MNTYSISLVITIFFEFTIFLISVQSQNNTNFICNDGQVIDIGKRCDGKKDCVDGMDETEQLCFQILCPLDKFRCFYGACIASNLECDGVKHCVDGSDESQCSKTSKKCGLNDFKCTNGECILSQKICDGKPDCKDKSDEGKFCKKIPACPTSMHRCNIGTCIYLNQRCDGHKDCIDGSDESKTLCENLKCNKGECLKDNSNFCPPISSERINIHCEVPSGPNKGITHCNVPLPPGTIANYECKPYYLPSSSKHKNNKQMICQPDGTWNRDILQCIPDCGIAEPDAAPLIVSGWVTEQGKYPWHAVLYTLEAGKWIFTCGGTLITERIVLTAAHCTWEISKEMLQVGLGKHYSDYDRIEDYSQVLNISDIIIQPAYQDLLGNYGSDIAILVLDGFVQFSPVIRPACIDWNLSDLTEHLSYNKLGLIVGMGVTEDNDFSDKLKGIYLPVVSNEECLEKQKREFRKYLTYTSFCAGWRNGSGVCNGDSGGGLVFPSSKNPNKYTIQGIVSVSPRRPGTSFCDPKYYTIFTKVGIYVEWIYDNLKKIHTHVKHEDNTIY